MKQACDAHAQVALRQIQGVVREYFHLKHRNEMRGSAASSTTIDSGGGRLRSPRRSAAHSSIYPELEFREP
jgi:hypothetical protein